MNIFWNNERLFKQSRARGAYAVTFVAFSLITEVGRRVYRPYMYRTGISDFGGAVTFSETLVVLTQIFLILTQLFLYLSLANATRRQGYRIIGVVSLGYIAYEVLKPVVPKGEIDWKDVMAIGIAGVIASLLFMTIQLLFPAEPKRKAKQV